MEQLHGLLAPFFNIQMIALVWAGVMAGVWIGAVPGLSVTMASALLISFTFPWELHNALALICGVYVGGVYGGAITSILLNIPGAPAAIAAGFDGYPLAKKGEAGRTIGLVTTVSVFGGLLGIAVLAVAAPLVASFALKVAPRDYFLLALMGLLLIGSIGGGDPVKGIIAGGVGVLLSMVGMDPSTGELRYTFGNIYLMAGINFITAMIGLFGLSEVLFQLRNPGREAVKQRLDRVVPDLRTFIRHLPLALRSGLLGVWIGALPGTGGDVAALLAYDQAKRSVKHNECPFGEGAIEGVIAPESANKGAIGGAFIPMLTLGIPGDAVTAIIIGALFIHGLRPGPMLMVDNPEIFWTIVSLLLIGNLALLVIGLLSVRMFSRVIEVPRRIILPIVVILSIIGTYSIQNSLMDVFWMIGFGVLGYFMRAYDYGTAPLVLGIILGPMLDSNYRRAMQAAGEKLGPFLAAFVTSPLSLFLTVCIACLILSQTSWWRERGQKRASRAVPADS